eukprot:1230148-Prymnesium_polylepis.1
MEPGTRALSPSKIHALLVLSCPAQHLRPAPDCRRGAPRLDPLVACAHPVPAAARRFSARGARHDAGANQPALVVSRWRQLPAPPSAGRCAPRRHARGLYGALRGRCGVMDVAGAATHRCPRARGRRLLGLEARRLQVRQVVRWCRHKAAAGWPHIGHHLPGDRQQHDRRAGHAREPGWLR